MILQNKDGLKASSNSEEAHSLGDNNYEQGWPKYLLGFKEVHILARHKHI
jgi:hypothetical protein